MPTINCNRRFSSKQRNKEKEENIISTRRSGENGRAGEQCVKEQKERKRKLEEIKEEGMSKLCLGFKSTDHILYLSYAILMTFVYNLHHLSKIQILFCLLFQKLA